MFTPYSIQHVTVKVIYFPSIISIMKCDEQVFTKLHKVGCSHYQNMTPLNRHVYLSYLPILTVGSNFLNITVTVPSIILLIWYPPPPSGILTVQQNLEPQYKGWTTVNSFLHHTHLLAYTPSRGKNMMRCLWWHGIMKSLLKHILSMMHC